MSIQEHVILVNDQGMVIGTQEKYAAHHPNPSASGLLLLAV